MSTSRVLGLVACSATSVAGCIILIRAIVVLILVVVVLRNASIITAFRRVTALRSEAIIELPVVGVGSGEIESTVLILVIVR